MPFKESQCLALMLLLFGRYPKPPRGFSTGAHQGHWCYACMSRWSFRGKKSLPYFIWYEKVIPTASTGYFDRILEQSVLIILMNVSSQGVVLLFSVSLNLTIWYSTYPITECFGATNWCSSTFFLFLCEKVTSDLEFLTWQPNCWYLLFGNI